MRYGGQRTRPLAMSAHPFLYGDACASKRERDAEPKLFFVGLLSMTPNSEIHYFASSVCWRQANEPIRRRATFINSVQLGLMGLRFLFFIGV